MEGKEGNGFIFGLIAGSIIAGAAGFAIGTFHIREKTLEEKRSILKRVVTEVVGPSAADGLDLFKPEEIDRLYNNAFGTGKKGDQEAILGGAAIFRKYGIGG
jgi:hypothetical protein